MLNVFYIFKWFNYDRYTNNATTTNYPLMHSIFNPINILKQFLFEIPNLWPYLSSEQTEYDIRISSICFHTKKPSLYGIRKEFYTRQKEQNIQNKLFFLLNKNIKFLSAHFEAEKIVICHCSLGTIIIIKNNLCCMKVPYVLCVCVWWLNI